MHDRTPHAAAAARYPHQSPASGPLVDVSSPEGGPGQHGNTYVQGFGNLADPLAIDGFLRIQEGRVNQFLQVSDRRAEAQRSALQQAADRLSNISNNIGAIVNQWITHPSTNQGSDLSHGLQKAYKRLADVESQHLQLKLEHEAIKKQLQEANAKVDEAVKARDELRRLADGVNWTGSAKVSDQEIWSKWKQLEYNIRSLASVLAKCQTKVPSDKLTRTRLDEVSTAWRKLLVIDDYKNFLIGAYIWTIVESVFTTGRKFCSGGHDIDLKAMRAAFLESASEVDNPSRPGPTLRHVARWFAQGTALFGHFFGRDQHASRREARSEVDRLKLFCNITADKSGTDFHQEMKAILEAALDLDEMLMSSKAIFLVRWPQDGQSKTLQRFDANQMESLAHTNELSSKTIVRFFVSPMLIKIGNADGCNYDSEMTLCKATVACE
ncbi:hypothetical protein BFJ70_g13435 [Fusarium oxysporum]|nr:hypothetical protein FOWG_06782 [Fusarium oxysporum f. sp. lycopersici MN25]KAJ4126426.1 hypothetical protein NW765_002211 [Fusarium oxysporum]KAJ4284331.1 hypothetical protein NW764_001881 [Fusarium oxysporum]RKL21475.1 hypothetical protein BFJ70_g13435 [Fusarium oxysporum]